MADDPGVAGGEPHRVIRYLRPMVFEDPVALRDKLVDGMVAAGVIRTATVEQAFRAVPRHVFLPGAGLAEAYSNEAIVTKWAADGRPLSSSSQPAIMALMLEQLDVRPGHRVLEIGAGTGYNAALLAQLTGAGGRVVTVDIDAELADLARARLTEAAAETAAAAGDGGGDGDVVVVCADGAGGDPGRGVFDRIIVTAGAWDLAPAWHEQLADGGRLVLPLSLRGMQRSVALEPAGPGWESVSVIDGGFMPLRGAMAEPGGPRQLGEVPGLFIALDDDRALDTDALFAALAGPGQPLPIGVTLDPGELWTGLSLWLALHEPDYCGLSALGPAVDCGLVPPLLTFAGYTSTFGLVDPASLAVLARRDPSENDGTGELVARGHGPNGVELARRLADQIHAWTQAGRPGTARLRIRAYPADTPAPEGSPAEPAGILVRKRHTQLLLDWPAG
jgi:protein-L-isoaspartate(D-aspartate) O-methyltransferase